MKIASPPNNPKKAFGLPEKPIACEEAAAILKGADQILTAKDRAEIAEGIEQARRRMNNEHLH